MNKNDLRYIKTDDLIKKTFTQVVSEKGFHKTSIRDICEKARISRNTFYMHYADKYVLLDNLFEEFQIRFDQSFTDNIGKEILNYNFENSVRWYMNNVREHRQEYLILLKCSTEKFLEVAMETIVNRPVRQQRKNYDKILQEDFKLQLNIIYMLQGMIHFTKMWLDNYEKITFEDAVKEMNQLCNGPVRLFITKIKD